MCILLQLSEANNNKRSTLFLDKQKTNNYVHLGFVCWPPSEGHTSKTSAGAREEASRSNSVMDVWKKKEVILYISSTVLYI